MDVKFIQVLYLDPFPEELEKELKKAKKIIVIENNSKSPLSDLIAEHTGIKIKNKILKYDGMPFYCNELKQEIKRLLK
jgi:2-oxoglutarate ferredoxin oxidoreductase subunit alpha